MKGLTHFITGVAVATFFKSAVQGADQHSFMLVWGGIAGILPDTLDFKFARFFEKNDYEMNPMDYDFNAQKMADDLKKWIAKAYKKKKTIKIQFHTYQIDVNKWRQYSVYFNTENNQIEVEIGPIVSTSQIPYRGTEPKKNQKGIAKLRGVKLDQTLDKKSTIDIMSGPSFAFTPNEKKIQIEFLPWHRQWSHSFTLGIFLGISAFLISGNITLSLIIASALIAHVAVDLLGFMGGNLFFPFTKKRSEGLKLLSASNPLANFGFIHLSIVLILWNLNRFGTMPVHWNFWQFIGWGFFLPFGLLLGIVKLSAWKPHKPDPEKEAEDEYSDDFTE